MDTGTYSFWFLAISAIILWLSVLLKLKWLRSTIGWWFLLLANVVLFITLFIFLLQLNVMPQWAVEQSRAIMYSVLGLTLVLLSFDIWRKNRHHWDWTKDDEC